MQADNNYDFEHNTYDYDAFCVRVDKHAYQSNDDVYYVANHTHDAYDGGDIHYHNPVYAARLSHKKLTCLSVEIKVSGESINLSIQA